MVGTLMTIPIDEYNNLKEYYDFQRKKEFNREQLRDAMEEMEQRTGLRVFMTFDEIWSRIDEKDYQEIPSSWVPKDSKWRIEGE